MIKAAVRQTEREFQDALVEYARLCGFRVAHFRAARTEKGWRTPVAYDGQGFPDLVLVGHGRVVFVECKGTGGKLASGQRAWIEWLQAHGQEAHVFWPSDWPWVQQLFGSQAKERR